MMHDGGGRGDGGGAMSPPTRVCTREVVVMVVVTLPCHVQLALAEGRWRPGLFAGRPSRVCVQDNLWLVWAVRLCRLARRRVC